MWPSGLTGSSVSQSNESTSAICAHSDKGSDPRSNGTRHFDVSIVACIVISIIIIIIIITALGGRVLRQNSLYWIVYGCYCYCCCCCWWWWWWWWRCCHLHHHDHQHNHHHQHYYYHRGRFTQRTQNALRNGNHVQLLSEKSRARLLSVPERPCAKKGDIAQLVVG